MQGHVWTPIENDVFWYKETIAPNIQALEIKKFPIQRTIEDMAKSLENAIFEIDSNDHFSTMNICREHGSHQTISIVPTFTIGSTPTSHIYTFYRGLTHVVENCPYRSNQVLIFCD